MTKSFTVRDLIRLCFRYIFLVIGLGVLCGLLMGFYAHHKQQTMYTASSSVLVQHDSTDDSSSKSTNANSQVNADINSMGTNAALVSDGAILTKVQAQLKSEYKLKISMDQLNKMVTAHPVANSVMLNVNAKSISKSEALKVSTVTARAFQKYAPEINPNMGRITITSKATQNVVTSDTRPSMKKYVLLGVALGMFVGIIAAFAIESFKIIR